MMAAPAIRLDVPHLLAGTEHVGVPIDRLCAVARADVRREDGSRRGHVALLCHCWSLQPSGRSHVQRIPARPPDVSHHGRVFGVADQPLIGLVAVSPHFTPTLNARPPRPSAEAPSSCLLYTSDAADDLL